MCVPLLIRRALEKARGWSLEVHDVELAVPRQIHELLAAAEIGRRGHAGHALQRGEAGDCGFFTGHIFYQYCALVALVEPGAALLRQNPCEPFTIQVRPLVAAVIQPLGQILQAGGIDLTNFFLNDSLAVGKLDRGEDFFSVDSSDALVAGLGHAGDEGCNSRLVIGEVRGTDEVVFTAWVGCILEFIEMMKHQDAPAQAVDAHLETGAIG